MDCDEVIKILFLGDITGRQGRNAVKSYLGHLKNNSALPDFVIANIENASHGFGLTKKNYDELYETGVNCFTSGNHIWDKKDIYEYIESADKLLRPLNYPEGTPGCGCRIFEIKGERFGVINVMGRAFMPPLDSPWKTTIDKIRELQRNNIKHILIDFHAEATAEKICFSKYLAGEFNTGENALIKGFFGTHTHVQTSDEKIQNGMAYITDTGFCGAADSVIGMEFSNSWKRMSTGLPERYEVSEDPAAQINGVEVLTTKTAAIGIKRINLLLNNNETDWSEMQSVLKEKETEGAALEG